MKAGTICEAARADGRMLQQGAGALLALCLVVLGFNWKYVFNFAAGPVPFTSALSANPGPREFVRASGELVPTGFVQESTLRLLRGLAESKRVSAAYLALRVEERLLFVKVQPEFSGSVVEGRLVPLPETIRASLGSQGAAHPWLLDGTRSYRWDFNLFVMVAGPLAPLLLGLFLYGTWQAGKAERHAEVAALSAFGPPAQVAARVEGELAGLGDAARVGPFWIGPSWIVTLSPGLQVVPATDLIAAGHAVTPQKSGTPKHALRLWRRGRILPVDTTVSESEARLVLQRLAELHAGRVVEDVAGFAERWSRSREACEAAVPARARPTV